MERNPLLRASRVRPPAYVSGMVTGLPYTAAVLEKTKWEMPRRLRDESEWTPASRCGEPTRSGSERVRWVGNRRCRVLLVPRGFARLEEENDSLVTQQNHQCEAQQARLAQALGHAPGPAPGIFDALGIPRHGDGRSFRHRTTGIRPARWRRGGATSLLPPENCRTRGLSFLPCECKGMLTDLRARGSAKSNKSEIRSSVAAGAFGIGALSLPCGGRRIPVDVLRRADSLRTDRAGGKHRFPRKDPKN